MAAGAEKNDIYIKYCMSLPREILTSVMTTNVKFSPPFFILKKGFLLNTTRSLFSQVNAARVSGDYRLSKDNWRLGLSSYLSSALGKLPT
jgi:hypothetical protein